MKSHSVTQLSRRKFISIVGGGAIIAVGSGLGSFALTRTPYSALAPWGLAGSYEEPRRFALSYAILAPNPHNLQPWLVDLSEDGVVTLLADPSRRLSATDPFDRQLTIGLGCFLELMDIAASALGYRIETTLFPEGTSTEMIGGKPVARATFFHENIPVDPLFTQTLNRRSTKKPFDLSRPVAPELIKQLSPKVPDIRFDGTVDSVRVASLRELTWQAWLTECSTPTAHQESVDLMRLGKAEVMSNPDGIYIGGMPVELLIAMRIMTRKGLATSGTTNYNAAMNMYQTMLDATPAFVWLASPDNTRSTQIAAGRGWLRLNLLTTQHGLALHPVSQCLQEYPEMVIHYQGARQIMAKRGETIQMLGRLGYSTSVPQTPRWNLDDKIKYA